MLLKALSQTLVKEHRFKFTVGDETHSFVVEEAVTKLSNWPDRFRLTISSSPHSEAKTFYGIDCYEVVTKAADFIAFRGRRSGVSKADLARRRPLTARRPALEILQCQESDSD